MRFGIAGWVVDPASGEIRRGAETLRLEPKVMGLLLYLAAHQGEVVTRDEVEEAVWPGAVVSYNALSGSIRKLRRALGDSARQPRIIETLSKRGYRLVASVVPVPEPARDGVPPLGGTMRRQIPPPGAWLTGIGVALSFALVLTIGILAWLQPWEGPPMATVTDIAARSIVVLPFAELNAEPDHRLLAEDLTNHLITVLATHPVPSLSVRDAGSLTTGQGLDIHYVVRGGVHWARGQVRIHVELLDARTGIVFWTGLLEGAAEDIARLQDQVAKSIESVLMRRLEGGSDTDWRQAVGGE